MPGAFAFIWRHGTGTTMPMAWAWLLIYYWQVNESHWHCVYFWLVRKSTLKERLKKRREKLRDTSALLSDSSDTQVELSQPILPQLTILILNQVNPPLIQCSTSIPISRWSVGPTTIQTQLSYLKVGGPHIDKLKICYKSWGLAMSSFHSWQSDLKYVCHSELG